MMMKKSVAIALSLRCVEQRHMLFSKKMPMNHSCPWQNVCKGVKFQRGKKSKHLLRQFLSLVTRDGVVHARDLAYLAECQEVADGEDDERSQGHHEEIDDDVGVHVVGRLPQLCHLMRRHTELILCKC